MNKRFRLSVFLVIFNLFSIYTFADEFDDPGLPMDGDPGEPPQTFINHYIIPLVVLAIIVGWYFTKSKQSKKI
jgi:hypothetical protein